MESLLHSIQLQVTSLETRMQTSQEATMQLQSENQTLRSDYGQVVGQLRQLRDDLNQTRDEMQRSGGNSKRRMVENKDRMTSVLPYGKYQDWPRFMQQLRLGFGPVYPFISIWMNSMRASPTMPTQETDDQLRMQCGCDEKHGWSLIWICGQSLG